MKHKKIDIPLEGRFKFIVIDTQEGTYIRGGSYGWGEHACIANNAREQEGLEGIVRGGGFIEVNPKKRRLFAFGRSGKYGSAHQLVVEQLLEGYCSNLGYKLNVVMDDVADGDLARKRERTMKESVQCSIATLKANRDHPTFREKCLKWSKECIEMLERQYWNYSEEYTNELKTLIEEMEREDKAK